MLSHRPAMFGDNRQCDSGDRIILVAEKQDSTCSRLNPLLQFISI